MHILCVASHPDDETLMCGATLARHARAGDTVRVLTFADGVGSRVESARERRAEMNDAQARRREYFAACEVLGAEIVVPQGSPDEYPDQMLDTVPLLVLVKAIESAVREYRPEVVYTHWPYDLNVDHHCLAEAVLVATRLVADSPVRRVLAGEIPESTSQAFGMPAFAPNVFVSFGEPEWERKAQAVGCYASEQRTFPHPRNTEGAYVYARMRGSQAGVLFAEAFMLLREVV